MTQYEAKLAKGGTVLMEFDGEDELEREMILSQVDLTIEAVQNVEEGTPTILTNEQ